MQSCALGRMTDYQRFQNVEFPWNKNSLNNTEAVEGSAIFITEHMIAAIKKIKQWKEGRPSGVIEEIVKARGREIGTAMTVLVNKDWKYSFIIDCYQGYDV